MTTDPSIVFHPQHRVGVVQQVIGSESFVAWCFGFDSWVPTQELEQHIERHFQREDYFGGLKAEKRKPLRSAGDNVDLYRAQVEAYKQHERFVTTFYSWLDEPHRRAKFLATQKPTPSPVHPWQQISPLMWKVIGRTNDFVQARQNFALFAFLQTLRGTDSYQHWRLILRKDLFRTANANRLEKLTKRQRKESEKKVKSDDKFASAVKTLLFDSYYSPQATAKSISGTRSLGREPCWQGDARPFGYRRVALHSNFPSPAYLVRLVRDFGYDGHAAYAALSHAHTPWLKESDRRQNTCDSMDGEDYNSSGIAGRVPQWQASPTIPTTFGGGHKAKDVVEKISRHNWDDKHSSAVFEVVYMRRKSFLVAASLGLKKTTLYQYCSRIRAELGIPETPDLHV